MGLITGICLVAGTTSLYLGYLFISKKPKAETNQYLGIFFILLALRLGKLPVQELGTAWFQNLYFNLMHASYLALGPVILSYTKSFLSGTKLKFGHFVPAFVFLLSASLARNLVGEQAWIVIYWVIQVHPLYYVIKSITLIHQPTTKGKFTQSQKIWLQSLAGSVLFITLTNALYFTLHFPFYLVSSVLMMICTYLIISLAVRGELDLLLNRQDRKYKNLRFSAEEARAIWWQLTDILNRKELFLQEGFKMADLSQELGHPTHVVSMVINSCSGMSFTEYINSRRIERAKEMISKTDNRKILAIAMDSGFSSLSAFNKAFKKNTGLTPTVYRSKNTGKH